VLPNAIYLANYIPNIITKLGEEGCLYVNNSVVEYFAPESIQANEIKSVTGAGDW
jgi:sugar/nucleoside kinase (ribokinase family)